MSTTEWLTGSFNAGRTARSQAKLRALLGFPVIAIVLATLWFGEGLNTTVQFIVAAQVVYILITLLLAARPQALPAEPLLIATAVLDPMFLSVWLPQIGEIGGFAVGLYLFTILGFGFRTGPKLMLLCQVASVAGFAGFTALEPFWHAHQTVWLSFILALVIVPLYANVLVKNLHEARARAERESEAKSQLLAKVSHELRTPLSGIAAAAQLIMAEAEDSRVVGRAETIMGLSKDLVREINDLLDQAKYEARALVMESTLFDLKDQVERLRLMLEPTAVRKGLEFTVRVDPRLTDRIQGDSHYLSKVLINMAGNAVKFTEKGSVEIALVMQEEHPDRYRIRFSVTDTGIGIPKEAQERIYEPFFQVDGGSARKYGGTGLGMTIAKEVVNLMGGQIELISQPGAGSAFSFELEFPRVRARHKGAAASSMRTVYGKHVLVVDDNLTNLTLIKEMLQQDRHRVVAAGSGAEALDKMNAIDFDVVFLDFNMGDMDGAKVLQIYRFAKLKTAPVFFLTADATAATASKLRAAGATGVLYKPITMEGIREAIARVCREALHGSGHAADGLPGVQAPASPPPISAVPAQYIDRGVIRGLAAMSDRPEFLAEVLRSAVADIERNCDDMLQALAARDFVRVRESAHALKGVSTSIGATRLESLSGRLMRATTEDVIDGGARLKADVAETSRLSVAAILDMLPDRAASG